MDRLRLMVCPHDTAKNPERWFFFSRYLSERLGTSVLVQPSLDFNDFHTHLDQAGMVYSNPQDSLRLIHEQGFLPVARANNLYDEVVFVAAKGIESPQLESLRGQRIASVTSMLVNRLALNILSENGITPGEVVDQGAWMKVINVISHGEFDYGFVYKDFCDDLSPLSKGNINCFHQSSAHKAFHMILLGPAHASRRDELCSLLLGMHDDDKGGKTLQELGMTRWVTVKDNELKGLQGILDAAA